MEFHLKPYEDSRDRELWEAFVSSSDYGWCWHTRRWKAFVLEAAKERRPVDRSFFVYQGDEPVALCPLVVVDRREGGRNSRSAGYDGAALPWPCLNPGKANARELLSFVIASAERIASDEGADSIRFWSSAPNLSSAAEALAYTVMRERQYLDTGYHSAVVSVGSTTLDTIRDRYRRYIKKYSPLIETTIKSGDAVTPEVEEAYFRLHVQDAGGQYRSRESYGLMCDLARRGEGFLVVASERASGESVGVLVISTLKGAAYDSSVGVNPAFADHYISHLMKWAAIEHLRTLGIDHYELGENYLASNWVRVISPKEAGITHFKEGWSRGAAKRIIIAEKYLTAEGLDGRLAALRESLSSRWFGTTD